MDLMRYYSDIIEKYPTYVTQTELCEICKICAKTAYNLEQRGEISYTVEQNRLIRTHKIKLTDILEYLYKKECRQELDSPYICAMKEFYERRLIPYPDLLSVKDVQKVTGFSSSAVVLSLIHIWPPTSARWLSLPRPARQWRRRAWRRSP